MFTSTSGEKKLIEELYIALQLFLLFILLNIAFPLLKQGHIGVIGVYVLSYAAYIIIKVVVYVKNIHFDGLAFNQIPNRVVTMGDGLYLAAFIYINSINGIDLISILYAYVVIQAIRYNGEKAWIFSIYTMILHVILVMNSMHEQKEIIGHIVEISLYLALMWIVEIPLKHIQELNREKGYYYDELSKKNIELKRMATTDYLTEMSNHQSFYTYFEELKRHAYRKGFPVSLTLIDIDNFKNINDTYGHLTGDHILKELAELVKSNIRKTDFAARYGGEEFAVIFPNTDSSTAIALSERIRKMVEEHAFINGENKIQLTISLGTDTYWPPQVIGDTGEFINKVDQLLYTAKRNGKNQVQYIDRAIS